MPYTDVDDVAMILATPARTAALRTFSVPSMFTERNRRAVLRQRLLGDVMVNHIHTAACHESRLEVADVALDEINVGGPAWVFNQVKPPAPIAGTHLLDEQRAEITGPPGHEASSHGLALVLRAGSFLSST